jgi:hypothetical protein
MKYSNPVAIMGMHRSGTTMLVRLLEEAGLLLGNRYGINREERFFLKYYLLRKYERDGRPS